MSEYERQRFSLGYEPEKGVRKKGSVSFYSNPPPGCAFHLRCPSATAVCKREVPAWPEIDDRWVACHHAEGELNCRARVTGRRLRPLWSRLSIGHVVTPISA